MRLSPRCFRLALPCASCGTGGIAKLRRWGLALVVVIAAIQVASKPLGAAGASKILLRDGRVLDGKLAPIAELVDDPRAALSPDAAARPRLILMIDDELRRIYVPKDHVRGANPPDDRVIEDRYHVFQRTPRSGSRIANVGRLVKVTEFDKFGHRMVTLRTAKGELNIAQGISEITPRWTKVEGIREIWDYRMATSSIPRETLTAILKNQIDPQSREERLKIVRFYLQCERYEDAEKELEGVVADFPGIHEQVASALKSLRNLMARKVRDEILLRSNAGQHALAYDLLTNFAERFPADQVAGEILQAVRAEKESYDARLQQGKELVQLLAGQIAELKEADRGRVQPVQEEIARDLNFTTLDRLNSYRQLSTDPKLLASEKVALAISGWLLGSDGATTNLPVALSLYEMRNYARQYLSEETKLDRSRMLGQVHSQEGASPETVARLIQHMPPPWDLPEADPQRPGYYQMTVPGAPDQPVITYSIQLPPEYDRYRRYPTIVALHGAGTSPEMMIDWWAGSADTGGRRLGQATRRGYIVVAPHWGKAGQREYGFSGQEHAAVLAGVRDACRRFAVDTDRLFLTGYSMGADAAWDMALAHPDLWAGVMPICGVSHKVTTYYWENARYVPTYVVMGELDGQALTANARDLQRYLIRKFDVTAVEFRGRGHENFSDEILNLFDWMEKRRRDFFPKEFEVHTMRSFDNFFWGVEVAGFPSGRDVDPARWPPKAGTRPLPVAAQVMANNVLRVKSGTDDVTVWLAPELVDFTKPIEVKFNGGRFGGRREEIRPDIGVILEDVRTRGDRQHPFWARVDLPAGKINLASGS